VISLRFARLRRRGVLVLTGGATGIALLGGGVAWAYWDSAASVPAYAVADSVGVGGQPTATADTGSITLTWPASTTVGGRAVGGYLVNRYAGPVGGSATPAARGTCSANPVTATRCTETSVPAGTWYYTITPVLGAWRGGESPRGNGISVADTFALSLPPGTTAGTASVLTITVKAGGRTDTGYTGARTLVFSGPGNAPSGAAPSYDNGRASVTFTNGVATVPLTLVKAENTTLSVADGPVSGSTTVAVAPGVASQFAVSAPSGAVAGVAQPVMVTAQDAYQNTATGYTGGRTLAWSGPGTAPDGTHSPVYPSSVTFTAGRATASVTLYRADNTTLTAADNGITGTSASFPVAAASASQFAVPTPATQTAGSPFSVTVTALDRFQNRATGYLGNKPLSWSGPGAAPDGAPAYGPAAFGSGAATVSITLAKAESTALAVSDGTIGGTSGTFAVDAGSPRLSWAAVTISRGALSSPCFITCSVTKIKNGGTFTARVSVTDADGNAVSGLTTSEAITLATDGGSLSTTSLTIAAGSTRSDSFTLTAQDGSWTSDTVTATSPDYGAISAAVSK
jgi:hypothetical protein